MENTLQSLLDLAGVNAVVVYDGAGRLVAQRGKAVYDRALCEQVGGPIGKAVDSIQLQHEDWEAVIARFGDGTIMLRNLGEVAGASHVLAVVADATLNPAFAAVAVRVAATKLKKLLAGATSMASLSAMPTSLGSSVGPPTAGSSQLGAARGPGSSQVFPPGSHPASGSRPALASSGLSWSKTGGSTFSSVAAADPAASAFLTRASKELARHVGPMAKVYVEEAVRRLCADATFTMAHGPALAEELAAQVEDPKDRAAFTKELTAGKAK
jgi:predicted regulator of Ras-like GTPase activity (Roadblock/LC7/MglB family)